MEDDLLDYRMPISMQIETVDFLQDKLLDVHHRWGHLPDYDGSYGALASALEQVMDTLRAAKLREDLMESDREVW